jgi:hypothetical protein
MNDKKTRESTEAAVGLGVIIIWCLTTTALIKFIFFM